MLRFQRQGGAAVIAALLVVALAASLVSALFLRQNVTVRSIENRLALSQTRWIERAAIDWAKVILRADAAAGPADHLGEPWAVPVAETRLDETVTAGAKIGDSNRPALIAGQILDMQSRFNLGSMAVNGQVSRPHVEASRRLFALLDLPESLAETVLARLLRSQPQIVDGKQVPAAAPPLLRLSDLGALPGFDAGILERMEPFFALIPASGAAPLATQININTAAVEVIAAMLPDLDVGSVRRLIARRERTFFRDLAEASAQIDGQPVLPPALFAVGSSYFMLRGMVRFDRVEVVSETLLSRASGRVDIVWQQRL